MNNLTSRNKKRLIDALIVGLGLLTIIGAIAYWHNEKPEISEQPTYQPKTEQNGSVKFETKGQIIKEMLEKSDRYCELTKDLQETVVRNGGTSFGISFEGSPNHKADGAYKMSRTYDFTLYENYPARRLATHSFSFDPATEKFYEYNSDLANNKLINTDKQLLIKYQQVDQQ